jgi:hypothetical protein
MKIESGAGNLKDRAPAALRILGDRGQFKVKE